MNGIDEGLAKIQNLYGAARRHIRLKGAIRRCASGSPALAQSLVLELTFALDQSLGADQLRVKENPRAVSPDDEACNSPASQQGND